MALASFARSVCFPPQALRWHSRPTPRERNRHGQSVRRRKGLSLPSAANSSYDGIPPASTHRARASSMIPSIDQAPASPLLMTKLHVPRPAWLISRPRLTAQLDEGFTRPFTLIAAPAGFGKTTLIADWLTQRICRRLGCRPGSVPMMTRRCSWSYVIAALDILQPGVGECALASAQLTRHPFGANHPEPADQCPRDLPPGVLSSSSTTIT